jgi:hypothetical protein
LSRNEGITIALVERKISSIASPTQTPIADSGISNDKDDGIVFAIASDTRRIASIALPS